MALDIAADLDLNGNAITNVGNVDGRDVSADGSKLDGIESGATGDMTGAEIKTAYEGESDTNAFTDAEKTKLAGVESGATADQSAAEILTAIKTVDGASSGLDADLLDGNEAADFATASHAHAASDITSGTLDNARVAQSNVTQHQGAIDHGSIAGLSDDDHTQYVAILPGTSARNVVTASGTGIIPIILAGNASSIVDLFQVYKGASKKLYVDSDGNTQVDGSIGVTGTVDGRDVAADGTKLDGIDSGAKAPGYGTLSELPSTPVDGELFFATDAAGGGGELVVYDGDNSQWRSAALHMHRLAYNVAASASTHQLLFGNLSTTDAACPIFLDDDITISHVRLGHLATEARARTLNIYANGSGTPSFTSSSFNLNTGSWGSQQFTVDTDFSAGDRLNVAVSGGAASTNTKLDCRVFFYYRY